MRFARVDGRPRPPGLTVTRWIVVLGLVAAAMAWSAPHADASASDDVYYLSVGDSLAQGFQPIGGPHTNSAAVGYRLHAPWVGGGLGWLGTPCPEGTATRNALSREGHRHASSRSGRAACRAAPS